MPQIIIITILISILNFKSVQNCDIVHQELSIETVDTINYWHILIDDKVVLQANHYFKDSEIEIESKKIPKEIKFDYRTDHGFEYNVDRIIEIQNNQNTVLERIENSTFKYGEKTKIPIGEHLKENEEIIIKCKFYISEDRIEKEKTFSNKRIIEKYRDKEKVKSFVICKLKKIK